MRLALVSLLTVGAIVATPAKGNACGPTETVLEGLLPRPGQADVPTNAVLWATGNHFELELRLRRVTPPVEGSSSADAGAEATAEPEVILIETTCLPRHNSRLCQGRAELSPNTSYEWQVVATGGGGEEGAWQSFTTGDVETESSPPELTVTVTQNDVFAFYGCGGEARVVGLQFGATELDQPVVVAADMSRDYPYAWGWVLAPGASQETVRYLPNEDCANLVAYDLAGAEYELRNICFDQELEPTYEHEDGTRVPLREVGDPTDDDAPTSNDTPTSGDNSEPAGEGSAPTSETTEGGQVIGANRVSSDSTGGCTISKRERSGAQEWAGLMLGLALALRRRAVRA